MRSLRTLILAGTAITASAGGLWFLSGKLLAQDKPTFKAKVDLVVLSFTVEDSRGNYINNLKPRDFKILEDGISQKISTFAEGNKPPMQVMADGTLKPMLDGAMGDPSQPGAGYSHGLPCRHQCVPVVRHQQLHVPRLRLCRGRHRRLYSRCRQSGLGGRLHLQPQSEPRVQSFAQS